MRKSRTWAAVWVAWIASTEEKFLIVSSAVARQLTADGGGAAGICRLAVPKLTLTWSGMVQVATWPAGRGLRGAVVSEAGLGLFWWFMAGLGRESGGGGVASSISSTIAVEAEKEFLGLLLLQMGDQPADPYPFIGDPGGAMFAQRRVPETAADGFLSACSSRSGTPEWCSATSSHWSLNTGEPEEPGLYHFCNEERAPVRRSLRLSRIASCLCSPLGCWMILTFSPTINLPV